MSYEGQLVVPATNSAFSVFFGGGTGFLPVNIGGSILVPGQAATANCVGGGKIAAPATPYCTIANIVCNQGDYVSSSYTQEPIGYGLGFTDGTKYIFVSANWGSATTMNVKVYECATNASTASSVFGQAFTSGQPTGSITWFQVRDDGTSIYFYIATENDGETQPKHWVKLYSQLRTSYLSAVTSICYIYYVTGTATGPNTYLTVNSWQTVAL